MPCIDSRSFPQRALDLILSHEGLDHGGWPGGESGVTIGYGYDLGYVRATEYEKDWKHHLPLSQFFLLMSCIGAKGEEARMRAGRIRGKVQITAQAAYSVFRYSTLPKYIGMARRTFDPGFSDLPAEVQGALVSLVFNRGDRLIGKNREEMYAIDRVLADGVQTGDLSLIAAHLRSMKRIWEGKGLNGLIRRREDEAKLVESCIDSCST